MKLILTILFTLTFNVYSADKVLDFNEIWEDIYAKSYDKISLEEEQKANQEGKSRAQRHWLPNLYTEARYFSTNDPTTVFFQHLGERSVVNSDFMPNELNNPSRATFLSSSIGLTLPLYEGGGKMAQVSFYDALMKSSQKQIAAQKSQEFVKLGDQFGMLLILNKSKRELTLLKDEINKLISSYQIGVQNNPVGYSGLLGLRGVLNRISSLILSHDLKISSAKKWIDEKLSSDKWQANTNLNLANFVDRNFSLEKDYSISNALLAKNYQSESLKVYSDIERSRFYPQVGLFAQNSFYNGSRENDTSLAVGIYLRWDIFNNDSYGRVSEAKARYLSQEAKLASLKQNERIDFYNLTSAKSTLIESLKILDDSEKILNEQAINAIKLYRSGNLTGLQLAEVANRRIDLIENKNRIEEDYLQTSTKIYFLGN
ncbi:MAG: TolC family protein [Bacteriovoracaceae bacterium]